MTPALLVDSQDGGARYSVHQPADNPHHPNVDQRTAGDFPSSFVHPLETSSDQQAGLLLLDYDPPREEYRVQPIGLVEASFRHSSWRIKRLQVWKSLKRIGATTNRLDQFSNCGSGAYVQVNEDTGDLRLSASYCHDRMCLRCGQARGLQVARSVACHCEAKLVRFATLTLRHSQTALSDQIDRLFSCFNRLKERKFWKEHVKGGVAFLEIKWIPRTRMWHPHLHLIVETAWLPQKELSTNWHAVTGDSFIVDVRPITSHEQGVNYVAKYAGKPVESCVYQDPTALDEFSQAIKGRRLYNKFGSWHTVEFEPSEPANNRWVSLGSLRELVDDANGGDPQAIRLLEALNRRNKHSQGQPSG